MDAATHPATLSVSPFLAASHRAKLRSACSAFDIESLGGGEEGGVGPILSATDGILLLQAEPARTWGLGWPSKRERWRGCPAGPPRPELHTDLDPPIRPSDTADGENATAGTAVMAESNETTVILAMRRLLPVIPTPWDAGRRRPVNAGFLLRFRASRAVASSCCRVSTRALVDGRSGSTESLLRIATTEQVCEDNGGRYRFFQESRPRKGWESRPRERG